MSDRLRELLRQRALLQEHLSWLDREIAAASDKGSTPSAGGTQPEPASAGITRVVPPAAAPTAITRPAAVVAAPAAPVEISAAGPADEILEKYRVAPTNLQQDVRRGCFLYFAAALVLFVVGVTILYFAISSR